MELLFLRPVAARAGGGRALGGAGPAVAPAQDRARRWGWSGGDALRAARSAGRGPLAGGGPATVPRCCASWSGTGGCRLPPYIKTYPDDPASYQTVYAAAPGSAAAPTAGLHFTPALLERLRDGGSGGGVRDPARGPGHVPAHPRGAWWKTTRIHREAYSVSAEALAALRAARAQGRPPGGRRAPRPPGCSRPWRGLGALDRQAPGSPPRRDSSRRWRPLPTAA